MAYVELDEGVRMLTNIVGCAPDEVRIGMPVEVVFEDVTPGGDAAEVQTVAIARAANRVPASPETTRGPMKELNYHRILIPSAEGHHDRVGVIDGAYRATYGQHIDRVGRLCAALRGLRVGRHDRFAVMALNSHQFLELYHAAFLGAGVINPLNLRLAPKELAYILADSESRVCFTDAPFAGVIDAVRKAAGIEQVVLIGDGDAPHDVTIEDSARRGDARRFPTSPKKTIRSILMYTGGTTGLPKGVLLDHRAEMLNLYHVRDGVAVRRPTTCTCTRRRCSTPRRWAASSASRRRAASSVFVPLFDPAAVLDAIEQHQRDDDGDGADDDRHAAGAPRVRARAARSSLTADLRRVADAGRAARTAARRVPRRSTSSRATA